LVNPLPAGEGRVQAARRRAGTAGRAKTGKRGTRARRKHRPRLNEQLGLSARGSWGGYRAGSGRKRIPRDKRGYVPHIPRPKVTKSTPVHVTLRCVDQLPSLRRKTHQRLIERVFARENRKGFRLIHFSIQTNHLHLIAEGDDTLALSRGIQRVASLVARRLNRRFKRKGRFFRERFDGKVIKSPKQMRNALKYVLLNHHKHRLESAHELVDGFDPFSSSRFFDGWKRPAPACRPPSRDGPVVAPRAWLLTTGWRRYGKLEAVWPG
jgi:REP-associated tyrosine transposase